MMVGAGGVLERAAVIAALSVIRLQAVHSVELRFQGDLVRRLVGGSVGHTERTLAYTRSFGWRLDGPVVVLVTATETVADAPPTRPRPSTCSTGWPTAGGRRWRPRSPARPWPAWPPRSSRCCRSTAARRRRCPRLVAAVTSRVNGRLRRVGRVLRHRHRPPGRSRCRRWPRRTARRSGRSASGRRSTAAQSVTHFDQLGVFRLLSLIPDSTELRTYVDEVLGPLADAADPDSADLRETLRVLLETNLNVAESARRLHFHYNTMRYRIGKLERLLGPFTSDPTLRLNLLLALHAARMRGLDQPHRPPVEAGLAMPVDEGLDALVSEAVPVFRITGLA